MMDDYNKLHLLLLLPSLMAKILSSGIFRWACGSANLFRKMTWEVLTSKKVGNNGIEENGDIPLLQKARKSLRNRVPLPEIVFSVFLFICASYNLVFHGNTSYYVNLYLQGLAFFLLGLDCI
ncbi:hypothetical protein EJB05_06394, partial [Eragrostis curvula]